MGPRHGDRAFGVEELPRREEEQIEVAPHRRLDAGLLHLHHHALAAAGGGEMDLCDGGRGQRLALERRMELVERQVEARRHHVAHGLERQHRCAVLQRLKGLDPLRREQILPHGWDLTQLDDAGPARTSRSTG